MRQASFALALASWTTALFGGNYDECILAHMAGARNDLAVASIQTACVHQVEVPLPVSVANILSRGTLAGYHPPLGFFMTIENRTTYAVTRFQLLVQENATGKANIYEINYFEPEAVSTGGAIITNKEHPDFHRINAGERLSFRAPIAETADSYEDWAAKFTYGIGKVWGYSTVKPNP